MTRVANALHGRQMKVGTRRRRAPVAECKYRAFVVKCFMTRVANALYGRQMKVGTRRRRAPVADHERFNLYPSDRVL